MSIRTSTARGSFVMHRARLLVLGVALLSAGITAPPAHAAPCGQWGFAGYTEFTQSNGLIMGFSSTGPRAQGAAGTYPQDDPYSIHIYTMRGTVDGGIDGSTVNFRVRWDGGEVGNYQGRVDANGFASGSTHDERTPSSRATWNSKKPLQCITPQPNPTPGPPLIPVPQPNPTPGPPLR